MIRQVGSIRMANYKVYGRCIFGRNNEVRESELKFVLAYTLEIVNTFFEKKDHYITYKNKGKISQIHYFM